MEAESTPPRFVCSGGRIKVSHTVSHENCSGDVASSPKEETQRTGRSAEPTEHARCRFCLTEAERRVLEPSLEGLTPRERDVTFAVCAGGDHEHVAAELCIAVPTLRTHLMRIHQKIGAENKSDIVRFVSARLVEAYRTRDPKLVERDNALSNNALSSKRSA